MGKILSGNSEGRQDSSVGAASAFARLALGKVGGSSVFIEPKKTRGKLLDMETIK